MAVRPEPCAVCAGPTDDLAITVALPDGRLVPWCSYCQDDAAPLSPRDELEERGTAVFEWHGHAVEIEVD